MTEKILAKYAQTIYAGGGHQAMIDATATLEQQGNTNGQRGQQEQGKHKEPLAKDANVATLAQQGIDKYTREDVAEELQEEQLEKQLVESGAMDSKTIAEAKIFLSRKTPPDIIEKKGPPLPLREYFPATVPTDGITAKRLEAFRTAAAGCRLNELPVSFLVRHYLLLRTSAQDEGVNIVFLKPLEQALQEKSVNIVQLINVAERQRNDHVRQLRQALQSERVQKLLKHPDFRTYRRKWLEKGIIVLAGGAIEADDITDLRLHEEVNLLNVMLQARGDNDLDALTKGLESITRLKPAEGAPAIPEDQRSIIQQRIVEQIQTVRREAERERREMEEEREEQRRHGWYGERRILAQEKQMIKEEIANYVRNRGGAVARLDKFFNRMFDRADIDPHVDFRHAMGSAGEKEYSDFKNLLNELRDEADRNFPELDTRLVRDAISEFSERYTHEYEMRELLHNSFFIAETGGEFKDFAGFCKQFMSQYADVAFKDAPEVEAALRIREQILYQIKREHNGYIPPELVMWNPQTRKSEWEERTREVVRDLARKGLFAFPYDPEHELANGWRIDRALSISRGLGMVLLRFPEIVAETPVPAPTEWNESQTSLPWETLVWDLNPLDHKVKRYKMGRQIRAILYSSLHRTKEGLWNQDELSESLMQDFFAVMGTTGGDPRMVDMRNLFHTGGPFSHTGWRPYNAALAESRDALRPLLQRNPGLAMKSLYNRYEVSGQIDKKRELREEFKQDPAYGGTGNQDKLARWQAELKTTEAAAQQAWKAEEIASWRKAARRVPHAILRIITDETNGLMTKAQRDALYEQVFGRNYSAGVYTHAEEDLTLAKEHLMKRRRDVIAAGGTWTEEQDQLLLDDFEFIPEEGGRRERALRLYQVVTRRMDTDNALLDKIFKKVAERAFPFAVTAEDVPWSEFAFSQTGPRGYFTRKINDAFSCAEATDEVIKLLKQMRVMRSPEDVVVQLKAIFDKAEIYDYERAQDAIFYLATGIIRLFEKDGILKIPLFGEVTSLFNAARHRGNSWAQTTFGMKAMAWESDDIYNFTEQLRQILDIHQVDALRKETGGTIWHALGTKSKIALLFLLLFGSYEMYEKVVKEK